jgi:hypothetical protein
MCAPYGSWVELLRRRGRETVRLIGFAYSDGAASAYRLRSDALSPDIDASVVPPPGYEGRVGEPTVLLPMLRLDFALEEARRAVARCLPVRSLRYQAPAPPASMRVDLGAAGRERRHIRQRNVRQRSFLPGWLVRAAPGLPVAN